MVFGVRGPRRIRPAGRPPGAAGSASRSGCSFAIRAGSSRLRREGAPARLPMDVDHAVGSPRPANLLPAGGRRRVRLHPIAAGDSGPQDLRGITPLAFRTASASFRKSPGSAVAFPHSRNRIVRIRCPWPLSLRRRAPGSRASVTGCAWAKPARPVQSAACGLSGQPFRSHPGPQRSGPRPVPRPVNERRPVVKRGQRVGPGVPAGVTDACGRCPATGRRAARRAVDQAHGLPRRPAESPAGPLPPPPRTAANPLSGASPTLEGLPMHPPHSPNCTAVSWPLS